MPEARAIAFYLPQFNPVAVNDQFWGKGFTEWTNVTKAKPLFPGHKQPKLPSDLGFYDLRVPETRIYQAELAKYAGIEGFCYWHYWFGNGKRVLERVFDEVVESGKPNFPFCLAWANQTWTGRWHGLDNEILVRQEYPGRKDYINHFYSVLNAFRDERYITVDGKILFLIFMPKDLPKEFLTVWRELAAKEKLRGFYFIGFGLDENNYKSLGYDGYIDQSPIEFQFRANIEKVVGKFTDILIHRGCKTMDYERFVEYHMDKNLRPNEFPVILPNWDNTPRLGSRGTVLIRSNPDKFYDAAKMSVSKLQQRDREKRLLFIKSWNEWAEGNYLEPDQLYGKEWLTAVRKAVA